MDATLTYTRFFFFYWNASNPDFLQTSDTQPFLYNQKNANDRETEMEKKKPKQWQKNSARRFKRWLHSLVNAIHMETVEARDVCEIIFDKLLIAVGDEICVHFLAANYDILTDGPARYVWAWKVRFAFCVADFDWNINNVLLNQFLFLYSFVCNMHTTKNKQRLWTDQGKNTNRRYNEFILS